MSVGEVAAAGVSPLVLCQQRLNYTFRDPSILESALTHASGAEHRLASNERMEFLEDAILGGVVCERLFRDFPEYLEGELTRLQAQNDELAAGSRDEEFNRLQDREPALT